MASSIGVVRDDAIATVTLSNPGKLNALDRAMWETLGQVMQELSADDALRCVVLRGAGDEAFAAGADIAEFATTRADAQQAAVYGELIHGAMQAVARCRHPVFAFQEARSKSVEVDPRFHDARDTPSGASSGFQCVKCRQDATGVAALVEKDELDWCLSDVGRRALGRE